MPKLSIERRDKPVRPAPKYPWLVWVFIGLAVAVLVGVAIAIPALGIPLF
jgi:hypothetical protein